MTKSPKRKPPVPLGLRAVRDDSSVGSFTRKIERKFKLPKGSVALLLTSRKPARSDKLIRALLRDWVW
jgi:hypothetical protein